MRNPYASRFVIPLAVSLLAGLVGSAKVSCADVVTVTARRMLDVDSGQLMTDPYIRIENGVITQVRMRNVFSMNNRVRSGTHICMLNAAPLVD